jgi:hypothetical protein
MNREVRSAAAQAPGFDQFRKIALALAFAAGIVTPVLLASTSPGARVGNEFQVNTITNGLLTNPVVATDAQGDFVVAWLGANNTGIYARRYNASGVAQGGVFRVDPSGNLNSQAGPSVAMDAQGDFVVTWLSRNETSCSACVHGIYAQRYDASGVPQGNPIQINSSVVAAFATAMDAKGDFVVTLDVGGPVYAQRYDASGIAQGAEFQVNTQTTVASPVGFTVVAMNAQGGFVVSWPTYAGSPYTHHVYAQLFNSSGVAQGSNFPVDQSGLAYEPDVAMDAQGAFVVTWPVYNAGAGYAIYAQRYDASAAAQGGVLQVSAITNSDQRNPAVAMGAQGDFVVTWAPTGTGGISARRYNASGVAQGGEFVVTPDSSGFTRGVAMDAQGGFVVGFPTGTGSNNGNIFAQRFSGAQDVDLGEVETSGPSAATAGASISYVHAVTNHATAVTPTGVVAIDAAIGSANTIQIVDTLPAGASFTGASGTNWGCSSAGGTVTCGYNAVLAPAGSTSLTINATASAFNGTASNNVELTAAQYDSNQANNSLSEPLTITGGRPPPPTGLTATPGNARATLKWTPSSGASNYSVYEGTTPGGEGSGAVLSGIQGTSAMIGGLSYGTTYYFTVRANSSTGTSVPSNEAQVTPPAPPASPTNLSATAGNSQATLTWNQAAGAANYRVYMGTSPGGESATAVQTGVVGNNPNTVTTTVTGLNGGTTYYFTVKSVNYVAISGPSNEASATPTGPPPAPSGLVATAGGPGVVNLTWTASTNALSYDVYEGTTSNGEAAAPVLTGAKATSAHLTGLTTGTTYFFKVSAINGSGQSPKSNEASAKPN